MANRYLGKTYANPDTQSRDLVSAFHREATVSNPYTRSLDI